jgi:hypothetical protein
MFFSWSKRPCFTSINWQYYCFACPYLPAFSKSRVGLQEFLSLIMSFSRSYCRCCCLLTKFWNSLKRFITYSFITSLLLDLVSCLVPIVSYIDIYFYTDFVDDLQGASCTIIYGIHFFRRYLYSGELIRSTFPRSSCYRRAASSSTVCASVFRNVPKSDDWSVSVVLLGRVHGVGEKVLWPWNTKLFIMDQCLRRLESVGQTTCDLV